MIINRLNQNAEGQAPLSFSWFFNFFLKKNAGHFLLLLVIVIFLLPVTKLVYLSFVSESGLGFEYYYDVFKDMRTWKVLSNTFYLVTGATFLSVILGVIMAWFIAYSDIRHKNLIQLFIFFPFIIPSYIVTLSWVQFMGHNGIAAKILHIFFESAELWNMYSMSGMIFVMGISHYPLVYLLTVGVLRRIPRELEFASRSSGAGKAKTFIKITLPLALPGIASGGLLAFLGSLDNFGVPAFLGIPANISVLSTYIYERIVGFGPSAFSRASVLSVTLGVIALFGTLFQWVFVRTSKRIETSHEDLHPRFLLGKKRIVVETFIWLFLIITGLIPFIAMAGTSLIKAYGLPFHLDNITFAHYHFLLFESEKVKIAIFNSIQLATITTLFSLFAGTMIAYFRVRKPNMLYRFVELIVGIPFALPGVVLALAMIFAWMEPIPGWNPGIYGSKLIILIAYISRFMILQVRGSITAFMQVDESMEEASSLSGANRYETWKKILLPLLLPGIISGAVFVLLTSLTELTVSTLLSSTGNETIGMVIFNFEQSGYTTYSSGFSSLVVLFVIIGMFVFGIMQKHHKKVTNYEFNNYKSL